MTARKKKKNRRPGASVWMPAEGSALFVRCAACGFQVETLRAVETGWTSSEHVAVKYRFCPGCGKPMHVYRPPEGTGPA